MIWLKHCFNHLFKQLRLITLVFLFFAVNTHADVLISVQDTQNQSSWNSQICRVMKQAVLSVKNENMTCILINSNQFQDERINQLQVSGKFHTHLRVFRDLANKIIITTQQWQRDDATDFINQNFILNKSTDKEQLEGIKLFSNNWALYRLNRYQFKADVLDAALLRKSEGVTYNSKDQVVDTLTQTPLTYAQAYKTFDQENERQHKYLVTALEVSAALGFGVYSYYKNEDVNRVDYDYPQFWKGLAKKFKGEAIKEDDNGTVANINHVFAGQVYYQIARNNGLKPFEAALTSITSSALWEFSEFREVFSINDMIVTGWGGALIGEGLYQVSRAIRNKTSNPYLRILAFIVDPFSAVNELADSISGNNARILRKGDLDLQQISQFDFIALKGRQTFSDGTTTEYKGLEMKSEVINIADWGVAGKFKKLYLETPVTEFDFKYTTSKFGIEDLKLVVQSILAGVYGKNRTPDSGYEYIIGLSGGFDWDQKKAEPFKFEDVENSQKDMWARVHVLGGTLKALGVYKGIQFNIDMKVHADYVMVSSYALEKLDKKENSRNGLLAVVKKNGYYYGTGFSEQLNASMSYGGVTVGASLIHDNVQNSGFAQRNDDLVTRPYMYGDERTAKKVYIRKMLGRSWAIEVSVAKINRRGQIGQDYYRSSTEKKFEAGVDYIW